MGAPLGNRNAAGQQDTERPFRDALRRAIAQDDGKRLRDTAEKLLTLASEGEPWAVKELVDRTDGKAMQGVDVSGSLGIRLAKVRTGVPDGS